MASTYSSESLQVLSGLEPVRRRPGMYTDTARPNHLVQEVVDNSVDEALAGFARDVEVTLCADGSIIVIDDGRGMPVDKHPEHGLTGVELILTKLHAGAKFDDEAYSFSGGLHGVGVSVVNALSTWLEVEVKRDGWLHRQRFENGDPATPLKAVASVGKRNTGTRIHFPAQCRVLRFRQRGQGPPSPSVAGQGGAVPGLVGQPHRRRRGGGKPALVL